MGIQYNLISGFFAALAGVFSKVAFNFGDEGTISTFVLPHFKTSGMLGEEHLKYVKYLLHGLAIIILILVNGLMMRFYVKSMHEHGAAKATVYNFAVNFLSSIVFGFLFFNELVNSRLLMGVVFILAGTFTISTCQHATVEPPKKEQYDKVAEKDEDKLRKQK